MTDPHNYGPNYGGQYDPNSGFNNPQTNPYAQQQPWDPNTQQPWDPNAQQQYPFTGGPVPPAGGGSNRPVLIAAGIAVVVIAAIVAVTIVFVSKGGSSDKPVATSSSTTPSVEATINRTPKAVVPTIGELSSITGLSIQGPIRQWTTVDSIGTDVKPLTCAVMVYINASSMGTPQSTYLAQFADGPDYAKADNKYFLAVGTYSSASAAQATLQKFSSDIQACGVGTVYGRTDTKVTWKLESADTSGKDFTAVESQATYDDGSPTTDWSCTHSTRVVANSVLYATYCGAGTSNNTQILDSMERNALGT